MDQLQPETQAVIDLKTNKKSMPLKTVDNFLLVMRNDSFYEGVRFNEMSGRAEVHKTVNGVLNIEKWSDTHEATSRAYIEKNYQIYDVGKHTDALRILFEERRYNPVKELVESVKWDGEERCIHFLHRWAKVEDSDYTREVSRLIFAGGIHRLYAPGTKFDDVPILIGTKQGEGKSSLIRYLAINDEFYGEVAQMEGQQSIEQLSGKWICEISELLALTKTKEQEAVKAYITRQVDTYRKPYDKQVTDLPRRCVFIGTSNNSNPLSDKSGNRRWYPVYVNCNGYDIFDHEAEIREYIGQCWAEALFKYNMGEMPNFANRKYVDLYREAQENGDFAFTVLKSSSHLPESGTVLLELSLAKGLEFDRVIIPDADADHYGADTLSRHRLYTAISRAVREITLLALKNAAPLLSERFTSVS